jgi:hypothetical protein
MPLDQVSADDAVRPVLLAQGGYYIATGVLPFVSRRAFEAVTGPKLEWWLVQTVGALVTVVGGGLIGAAVRRRSTPELLGIAAGSAASLAGIDVVYVAKGRIAPTYLADAAIQVGLLGALGWRLRGGGRLRAGEPPSGTRRRASWRRSAATTAPPHAQRI